MIRTFFLLFLSLPALGSILPDNDLRIPVDVKIQGLNESEYHSVINKFEMVFRDEIAANGKTLTINRLWESPVVNAGTLRKGKEWIINLYGGYARHPLITPEGYSLVICHELGHHLGGPPKKTFETGPGWPSVEGQSDYFATNICLKKLFAQDEVTVDVENPIVEEHCARSYAEGGSRKICKRILMAALSVSAVSASIRRTIVPDLLSKDESIVTQTFESHPEPQCRLDTYVSGAMDKARPGCWFGQE